MSGDDQMNFRKFLDWLRPYRPDPEKEVTLDAALDLLRCNVDKIVVASDDIAAAKRRADVREALGSLGRAVSK